MNGRFAQLRLIVTISCVVMLAACQFAAPKDSDTLGRMNEMLSEAVHTHPQSQVEPTQVPKLGKKPPSEVSAALVPPIELSLPADVLAVPAQPRFDVSVNKAPAREFLMGLVEGTSYNMVVHPDVSGTVSLTLKNVTIPEVMQTLRDVYGYEYEAANSGYRVLPARLQSRVYLLDYLNLVRRGKSQTLVVSGQLRNGKNSSNRDGSSGSGAVVSGKSSSSAVVSGSLVDTQTETDLWSELRTALESIVRPGGDRTVVVNPMTGVVVVRAMPGELRDVERFLGITQQNVKRQVVLEAKILEVELNDSFQSGINWAALFKINGNPLILGQTGGGTLFDTGASEILGNSGNLNPKAFVPVDGTTTSAFGGAFTASLQTGDFTSFIELLETQGNVQVLSSPRISTVNNQKAIIKVGTDEFFVTDISTTTVTGGGGTTTSPDITLTPFFSGIALDVTPQIDRRGNVILHIHPTVSEVFDQTKPITIGDETLKVPLALSNIRESDSIVSAHSGQVVVIGGLMKNETRDDTGGTPFLSDIPVVGKLFQHAKRSSLKSELVILLRPIVIDAPGAWQDVLSDSAGRIRDLSREIQTGGQGWLRDRADEDSGQ